MAFYDYLCPRCGPFTEMRPMALSAEPDDCPSCGTSSPRAYLSAPALADMVTESRVAHARNERSAHEPRVASKHVCGSGCHHSKPKTAAGKAYKSFPGARPWSLSH
jgi:putative FmdB family regulatory protein